jgi:hypothetical protein
MSRAFAGPSTDVISFAAGNAPPDQGPWTLMALVKSSSGTFGWVCGGGVNGTSTVWAMGLDSSKWFIWNDFTAGNSSGVASGNWFWVAVTKASGNVTPRWHFKNVTAGTAWSHAAAGGTVADNTGTFSGIRVGNYPSGATGNCWQGEIAVVAACDTAMTDLQVEAACTLAASDTLTAITGSTKKWMVRLNQASIATSVPDDTGGGGGQNAITGTTVGATDPPGYNYSISSLTPFTKDLTVNWRVLNGITKDVRVNWRVLGSFTKDLTTLWRVLNPLTKDVILKWRVLNAITKDVTLDWRVLNAVTKDLTIDWRVLNSFTKDLTLDWRVLNALTKDLTLDWRVLNTITKDVTLKWRVLNSFTKDVTLDWRVLNAITKDVRLNWRVLNPVQKDLVLKWDVLAGTSFVKDLGLRWRVLNPVQSDLNVRWRVLNGVQSDLAIRWRVLNPLQRDLTLRWDVLANTSFTKDLRMQWRVLNPVQRDLLLRWRILSAALPDPLPADVIAYLEDNAVAILIPESVIARL